MCKIFIFPCIWHNLSNCICFGLVGFVCFVVLGFFCGFFFVLFCFGWLVFGFFFFVCFLLLDHLLDNFDTVLGTDWFYTKNRISVSSTMLCGNHQTNSMSGCGLLMLFSIYSLIFQPRAGICLWKIRQLLVFCSLSTTLWRNCCCRL